MKPVVRYRMNFASKWLTGSAFFAGISFFLWVLYFFVLGNIETVHGGAWFFGAVLPLVLLGVHMLLVRLVRINLPPVFGGLAALYCLCLMISNFLVSSGWINVLELVWYVLCLGAMAMSLLGYFKGKWYLAFAFFAAAAARFFLRNFMGYFDPLEPVKAVYDAGILCGLVSMSCLWASLRTKPVRKNAERA